MRTEVGISTRRLRRWFYKTTAGITRHLLAMAKELEMEVVAGGIETPEQNDFLAGLGCHHGQVYLVGRPMNAGALVTFLAR